MKPSFVTPPTLPTGSDRLERADALRDRAAERRHLIPPKQAGNSDRQHSVAVAGNELTPSNAGGVRHRVYVDVHVAVASLLENLRQCGPA